MLKYPVSEKTEAAQMYRKDLLNGTALAQLWQTAGMVRTAVVGAQASWQKKMEMTICNHIWHQRLSIARHRHPCLDFNNINTCR